MVVGTPKKQQTPRQRQNNQAATENKFSSGAAAANAQHYATYKLNTPLLRNGRTPHISNGLRTSDMGVGGSEKLKLPHISSQNTLGPPQGEHQKVR